MIINIPNIGPTKFRDDLSPQEFQAQLAALTKKYGVQLPKPEVGIGTLAKRGFMRSVGELGIAGGDVIPAMAASSLGFNDYAKQQMQEAASSRAALEGQYPTQFKSYTEVGSPYEALQFGAETLGEVGGDLLGAVIPGVGGAATASRFAAKKAAMKGLDNVAAQQYVSDQARKGMYGGVYFGSFAQNAPEVFQNIYQETNKFEPGLAALTGGISAVLDTIVPGQLLDQLGNYGRQKLVAEVAKQTGAAPKLWKAMAAGAAKTAGQEGLTEGAQESLSAAAEQIAGSNKDVFAPENIQRYKEAFVKGAIGGGAIGTVGGAAGYRGEKQAYEEQQAFNEGYNGPTPTPEPTVTPPVQPSPAERFGTAFENVPDLQRQLDQVTALKSQLATLQPGTPQHTAVAENIAAQENLIQSRYGRDLAVQQAAQEAAQEAATQQPTVETPPEQPGVIQPPSFVATPEFIKGLGIKKNSGLGKLLAGMDLGDVDNLRKVLQAASEGTITGSAKQEAALNKLLTILPQDVVTKAKEQVSSVQQPITETPNMEQAPETTGISETTVSQPEISTEPSPNLGYTPGVYPESPTPPAQETAPQEQPAPTKVPGFTTANGTTYTVDETGKTSRKGGEPHPTMYVDDKSRRAISNIIQTKQGGATVNLGYDSQGNFVPVRTLEDIPAGAEPVVGVVNKKTNEPIKTFPADLQPSVGAYPVAKLHRPEGQGPASTYIGRDAISDLGGVEQAPVQQAAPQSTIAPAQQIPEEQNVEALKASQFKPTDVEAKGASTYFKRLNVEDALKHIAYESIAEPEGSNVGKRARLADSWVRKNMAPETVKRLDKYVRRYKKDMENVSQRTTEEKTPKPTVNKPAKEGKEAPKGKVSAAKAVESSDTQDFYDTHIPQELKDIVEGQNKYDLYADIIDLQMPLHPEINSTLESGNLPQALQQLADRTTGSTAKIASALSKYMAGVKVEFGGRSRYSPTTNTITLREGATRYDLLHEASHAAMSHVIGKPSYPVTKQLNALFKEVQSRIDPAYGTQDLQEFVAEAWSNDAFRRQLSEMRTQNSAISLWDKFVALVRRLFGFPPRPDANTLDVVDALLNKIISTPPAVRFGDSLYAQSIHDPKLGTKIFNGVDKVVQSAPYMNEERAAKFWGSLENLNTKGKELAYKSLNLSALGQVSKPVFGDIGVEFSDTVDSMSGYQETMQERVQPLHLRLQKFAQAPGYQAWSTLVHDSTIADIDPNPSARAKYAKDKDRLPKYTALNARFNKLTPEAKKLYNDLFAAYKTLNAEMIKSLETNTLASIPDKEAARSAYRKILEQLNSVKIDHYAPLFRRGTYRLSYSKDGDRHVEFFESQAERSAARKKLSDAGAMGFDEYVDMAQEISKDPPDGTVIANIISILKDTGASSDAVERVAQLVAKSLPETSMYKRRMKREGTGGYIDDAALVFDNVTSGTIHQLSRAKYSQDLQRLSMAMAEKGNQLRGPDQEKARLLLQEFETRRDFIMNPTISSWAQLASTGSFFYFLAANVSSAVVNMAQVPLIVVPQLGGSYGFRNATKALNAAMSLYGGSGLKRDVVDISGNKSTEKAMLSIENLVNAGKADRYRGLVEKLKAYGFLQTSTARDAVISAEQPNSAYGGTTRLHYLTNLVGTFMFHHAERFNREVTAIAAHDLELQKLQGNSKLTAEQKEAQAIDRAIRAVEFMHGAGHTLTGPSIGHSDLGKIFMVFKRFAFSMYYMLFDTMMRALPVKGASGEQLDGIRMARRQLIGLYGMSAIFAGVKGLPMYWVAEMAYNALKEDDEDDFDAVVRDFLGDMPFKGPVNYFTNLSIADRVGWEDLIFREAKKDKADASTLSAYLESLAGAPYSIVNNMFRAKDLVAQGQYERAVETALPTSMSNVLKGLRFGTEGVNTLRGDPIMGEVQPHTALFQVFGFGPADLNLQYKTNEYRKQTSDKLMGMRDNLMKKYYLAYRVGDFDRESNLHEELMALGEKHPELGITEQYIQRSIRTRDQISAEMVNGIHIPKQFRNTVTEMFND